ncbi:MAG: hydroxysqualene dehydroxylase HpnE [Lautropia sp.]|nr:hydroxysqualene dehydroxylase HpnE [Lautropia sp.]
MTERSLSQPSVFIIGAGWSGLSAAIQLVRAGRRVRVLEAAPQAGGRARRQVLNWPDGSEIILDNGQHLLLGAYRETLALIRSLGGRGMKRLPFDWQNVAGVRLQRHGQGGASSGDESISRQLAESLSMVGAMVNAQGLSRRLRVSLLRTLVMARLTHWRPAVGVRTVADWFERTGQPPALIRQLWEPLVVSAMNTPPELASAATFLRVLRDSLGKEPAASDFVLAGEDLAALLVDPALAFLGKHGMPVALRTPVREISREPDGRFTLRVQDPVEGEQQLRAEQIVLATPPAVSARLLAGVLDAATLAPLNAFDYRPITTAYVGWKAELPGLPAHLPVMMSLIGPEGAPEGDGPAHWFFDRGEQAGWRLAALVISDSGQALARGDEALLAGLQRQLTQLLKLPPAGHIALIHEKRATFACTPERPVVPPGFLQPQLPGLVLAGDYSYGPYPATLEGAVRSGRMAAELLLDGD